MRYALHSVIADGSIDDYRTQHVRIPDDLQALFTEVGIREWTIWRSGYRLFHLVECDDFAASMAAIDEHPANVRWQKTIGPFVDEFYQADGTPGFTPIEEVWDLTQQRDAGPVQP